MTALFRRPPARVLAAVVLVGIAAAAHFTAVASGPDYTGLLRFGSHAYALMAAGGMLWICSSIGLRLLRLVGVRLEFPMERLPFAATLGIAAVGTILLMGGAVGGLRWWGVLPLMAVLAAVGWSERRELAGTIRELPADLRRAVPEDGLRRLGLIVSALGMGFILVWALPPVWEWDALVYHLDVPAEYLESGWVHLPEDNRHAVYLGPVQFLYIPLLAIGSQQGAAVLSGMIGALLVMLLVSAASRLLSPEAAGLALVAVWGNTNWMRVAGSPMIDGTLVLFTFAGFYALLLVLRSAGDRRLLSLSAVLLGAAVGVKLHAAAWALAMSPLALIAVWRSVEQSEDSRMWLERTRLFTFWAALGLAVGLPWLIRSFVFGGSPFYPLFADLIIPPWIQDLAGSINILAEVDPYVLDWMGAIREPFSLRSLVLAPWRLSVDDYFFNSPLLLLSPLAFLDFRSRYVRWMIWAVVAYAVILLAPFPRTNLRYLLPSVLPMTLVTVQGILVALRKLPMERWSVVITLAVCYLSLAPTALYATLTGPSLFFYVIGTQSETEFMSSPSLPGQLHTMIEDVVPPTGRVLLLVEARGYGAKRDILQDNSGRNWAFLATTGAPQHCLSGSGITHVGRNNLILDFWVRRGLDQARLFPGLTEFIDRCLVRVARSTGFELYEVRELDPSPIRPGG